MKPLEDFGYFDLLPIDVSSIHFFNAFFCFFEFLKLNVTFLQV